MNRNFRGKSPLPQYLRSPLTTQFKSPVTSIKKTQTTVETPEEKSAKVLALREKLTDIQGQIAGLENQGFKETELQDHIDKLHEYNEVKDAASVTLGRIAVFQGIQTKDLYQRYGLDLTD